MVSERQQFYNYILCTAVEGGINYWSQVSEYRWDGREVATVTVHELFEDQKVATITADSIRDAYSVILDTDTLIQLSNDIRAHLIKAFLDCDAGEVDAGDADILLQLAMFGEVIYG
jgi:hypothetical protein